MEVLLHLQVVKIPVRYYRVSHYKMGPEMMRILMIMVLIIPTEEGFIVKTVTRPLKTVSLEITLQMKEVEAEYFAMSRRPLSLAARSLVMRPMMLVEGSTLGPLQALNFITVFFMTT